MKSSQVNPNIGSSNINAIAGGIAVQENTVSLNISGFLKGVKWQAVHQISSLGEKSHRIPETIWFADEGWPFGLHKLQKSTPSVTSTFKVKMSLSNTFSTVMVNSAHLLRLFSLHSILVATEYTFWKNTYCKDAIFSLRKEISKAQTATGLKDKFVFLHLKPYNTDIFQVIGCSTALSWQTVQS